MAYREQNRVFFRRDVVSTKGPDGSSTILTQSNIPWVDQTNGVKLPGYKSLIAAHAPATTVFTGDRFEIRGNTKGYYVGVLQRHTPFPGTYSEIKYESRGDILDAGTVPYLNSFSNVVLRDRVRNQALSSFYNDAWNTIRSFQSGVFLGEVKQALNMMRNPAKAIRSGLNDYADLARKRARKASRRDGRKVPRNTPSVERALADTWLEYAFGWAPLISDVKSANSAFKRLSSAPYEFQKVRSQKGESADLGYAPMPSRQYVPLCYGVLQILVKCTPTIGTAECRIIGQVKCEIEKPIHMHQQVLGFTWNDFVPTVWELIPYSFLVDYFSNIGDIINAWSFPAGTLCWFNRTTRMRTTKSVSGEHAPMFNSLPAYYKTASDTGPSFKVDIEKKVISRDGSNLGFPNVSLEIPGSGLKWLNIAALGRLRFV